VHPTFARSSGPSRRLKATLAADTQADGLDKRIINDLETLAVLQKQAGIVHNMMRALDHAKFRTQAQQQLPTVVDHVAGLDDGKKPFTDTVLPASKAFALYCTPDEALAHRDGLAFLQAVKAAPTSIATPTKVERR
jgi:type I restriction enzyme R subunit